jgi:hypothetical protein
MESKEMNIDKVCKNVGWDGESFFCMRCGKAGFNTKAKAVGHQSQCQARNASLVVPPPTTTPPPDHHHITTTLPLAGMVPPPSNIERQLAMFGQQIADMRQEQTKYTNEIPHLQAVQNMGFLGISKEGWIIIGVVALLAYSMGHSSSCRCPVNEGSSRRTGGRLSTIQDKVTDKAISYGISKMFK